ncbi:MAG: FadR/GntR family transcriptional regulator [Sphaerochaeta sp.]|jgi:GntR family transcriptional repressor for pyruvate dehydrogenase complex|uniref:FadR/GntR family transcriptional regulator n=1 Tax=Sphaerochaeta sp. TaxID=1972642 RepID=UPI002FCB3DAE
MNSEKPIKPIAKDLIHEKVTDALISYIYRSGLKIGDKLPGERQLAQELAVGRNSVRQGLCQLEEKGIIERMVGKGAFVKREVTADSIQLKLMRVNYQDLLEIKICIEQLAIRRAVDCATDEQIAHLKVLADRLCAMADEGKFSVEVDRQFHIALLECGGSSTLTQLVLSLIDSLNSFTNILGNVSDIWVRTIPFHRDIVTALEQRQASYAIAAHEYIYRYDLEVLNSLTET